MRWMTLVAIGLAFGLTIEAATPRPATTGQQNKPVVIPNDIRSVNGTNYNVGYLIAWERSGGALNWHQPANVSGKKSPRQRPLPDWREVMGEVERVSKDGIILRQRGESAGGLPMEWSFLIRNHPKQDAIAVGDRLSCWAMQIGMYEAKGIGRIRAYDHGIPVKDKS